MKYTLNTYGWSAEFIGKKLTTEQLEKINVLMYENKVEDVASIRFDLDDTEDFDIWDGDLLHTTKPLDNNTMLFQVLDEDDNLVLEFGIEDLVSMGEVNEDVYDNLNNYEVFPTENSSAYLSVDEFKGGIFSYEIESEETPKAKDFNYLTNTIDTPDGDWDIIDKVYFKGVELEIVDFLDNTGKAATVDVFNWEE